MSSAFHSSFHSVDPTWSLCDGMAYRVIEEDWTGMQESVNTLEISINQLKKEGNTGLSGVLANLLLN